MPGRTDTWILSDAAAAHGRARPRPSASRSFATSTSAISVESSTSPGRARASCPECVPLLEALERREDAYLALLTGNYEEAARAKLAYFDLWRYFRCGAFGDDAPDRNGLLPRAVAKIRECGGPVVAPRDVVVIGDTPLDVACAAASGARSVAVATGGFDVEALRKPAPMWCCRTSATRAKSCAPCELVDVHARRRASLRSGGRPRRAAPSASLPA